MTGKFEEIKKLKEEIETEQKIIDWEEKQETWLQHFTLLYKKREKVKILQAKLQTWKEALTLKLKDVEKDKFTFEKLQLQLSSNDSDDWDIALSEVRQKLKEKQAEKNEIIKELGEMK